MAGAALRPPERASGPENRLAIGPRGGHLRGCRPRDCRAVAGCTDLDPQTNHRHFGPPHVHARAHPVAPLVAGACRVWSRGSEQHRNPHDRLLGLPAGE